jgi:hypothetical protein
VTASHYTSRYEVLQRESGLAPRVLGLVLDANYLRYARPLHLVGGMALDTHWTRGWLATIFTLDSTDKRTVSSLVRIDLSFLHCRGPAGLFLTKGPQYRKSMDVVLFNVSLDVVVGLVAIQHHKLGMGVVVPKYLVRRLSLVSYFRDFLHLLPGSCRQGILHHTNDHRSKFVPIRHLLIMLPFEAGWTKLLMIFFFDVLTSIVSFLWASSTEKLWLTV